MQMVSVVGWLPAQVAKEANELKTAKLMQITCPTN